VEDPLGEQGHLIRGAAGVSFVELIVFFVDFFGIGHGRRGWIQRSPDRPRLEVERGRKRLDTGFARQLVSPKEDFKKVLNRRKMPAAT
jgi:hypothetical protein